MLEDDIPRTTIVAAPIERPLSRLDDIPPPPTWFVDNLAAPFETLDVVLPDGRRVDARAWGDRGLPGLLFIHGNSAHLGWWSFLAPFFADRFRVATFSLSGMGRSDWRTQYSAASFAEEMWAVADAGGIGDAEAPPAIVAHSMGGLPLIHSAARMHRPIGAAILVDVGLPGIEDVIIPPYAGHRLYPSEDAAVQRFRLSPPQPCENRWILEYLAREAVHHVTDADGAEGWSWRFDPILWGGVAESQIWRELADMRCPVALVRGQKSPLTGAKMIKAMCDALPGKVPVIDIPDAYHHVMIDQPIATTAVLNALLAAWPTR